MNTRNEAPKQAPYVGAPDRRPSTPKPDFTDWTRPEWDDCQCGTPGCSVDHDAAERAGFPVVACETW